MLIRAATDVDWPAIWAVMEPTIREGETYALDRGMTSEQARVWWMAAGHEVSVAEADGEVLGTSFLRPNQPGPGAHVGNCGYMVAPSAFGRGIARALCQHTQDRGRERGFRALQFNFVVSTNVRAVATWEGLGFHVAGVMPGAFRRPNGDYVDAFMMFKSLV
jgi:ribosomal protein S18 acetylase RimI-like enzyme